MLPAKEDNIYPKSDENLKALIAHYFDKYDIDQTSGVELLKRRASLALNQTEFLVKKLSEVYIPVFKQYLNSEVTLSNLLKYGFDALDGNPVNGSKMRQKITTEFEQFLIET